MDLSVQKKRKEEAEIHRKKKAEEEEEALCLKEDTRKRHEVRYLLVDITSRLFVFVTTVNLQQSIPQYDDAKLWISPYISHAKRNPKWVKNTLGTSLDYQFLNKKYLDANFSVSKMK